MIKNSDIWNAQANKMLDDVAARNVSAPVENNELMQKEFERWSRDEAAYRINHNPMSGFACSKYGFEAGYKAALSLESKPWWHDAHLRLPEEGNREKIDEWEACYALLFNQLNDLVPRLQDEIKTLRESKQGWQEVSTAPKTGEIIYMPVSAKWTPYKAASDQFRRGIKGRWQVHNGYGWENMDGEPLYWLPCPTTSPEIAEDK